MTTYIEEAIEEEQMQNKENEIKSEIISKVAEYFFDKNEGTSESDLQRIMGELEKLNTKLHLIQKGAV